MDTKDTALVVIDVQRGILDIPGLARKKEIDQALDGTVQRVASLLQRARRARIPILYVQHDGGRGHRLEPDTPGWPIRREVFPLSAEPVIRKRACDAFFETGFRRISPHAASNSL